MSKIFSSFLIGEGTLLIQCAEILRSRGHTIYGIISSEPSIKHWAKEREVPFSDPIDTDITTMLRQYPFDYLFSIVNPSILSEEILALPHKGAINYHDSPLPKYAGTHATSWALMGGESFYGISWHAMTKYVDAGDIYKQPIIEIDDGETAFTLNVKCYEAAIQSFAELVIDIESGRAKLSKQYLSERTFFPRTKRPPSGCVLSWDQSARQIGAFARALNYGPYPNELGLPKISIGGNFFLVPEIDVVDSTTGISPGIISRIDVHSLTISTLDGYVRISKLLTIDGESLSISQLIRHFDLYEGYQLEKMSRDMETRLASYIDKICQYEPFWVDRLKNLKKPIIPYFNNKNSNNSHSRLMNEEVSLPDSVLAFLKSPPENWQGTNFLVIAFTAYIARVCSMQSFDIGFRDSDLQHELLGLNGFFAEYVSLHVEAEYTQDFTELYAKMQSEIAQTKQHKTYSRDIKMRYPALHSLEKSAEAHILGVIVEQVERIEDYEYARGSDLHFIITRDQAECRLIYNIDDMDEEAALCIRSQFITFLQALIAGIVAQIEQTLGEVSLLTVAEKERILVEWNATKRPYPSEQSISQLFEEQVAQSTEAVAVVYQEQQVTYGKLNARANKLAHYLQKLGVGPEVLVGVYVERSVAMVEGVLAVLKAGGAYVPLDPSYPPERLGFMLQDAQVSVLLTQSHLRQALYLDEVPLLCLDSDEPLFADEFAGNLINATVPENLAYVIYTSGSTGKPKGVALSHRALCNRIAWQLQYSQVSWSARTLQFAALSFDASFHEMFSTWCSGGTLVLASEETRRDGIALWGLLSNEAIERLFVPFVALQHLAEVAKSHDLANSQLHEIITAGEQLQITPAIRSLFSALEECTLCNDYGPSETHGVTAYKLPGVPGNWPLLPPLGYPINNTRIYVLDPLLQPLPVGIAGELYIGGICLGRGYHNRPELTAERFLPDPFSQEPGTRLYKTGDRARYLPSGVIEFLGRSDQQVKIRGFRIELGEIEATLTQHSGIRQAVVLAREDEPWGKRLVAYVVMEQPAQPTVGELRHFLSRTLPEYMVPTVFVPLERLPLTPSGKIDRKALPIPDQLQTVASQTYVAPATPTEQLIAGIWTDTLKLDHIGIHDSFFELGGHSLLATQVVSKTNQALGTNLSLTQLLLTPTIREIAAHLSTKPVSEYQVNIPRLAPADHYPLSSAQRGIFMLHLIAPDSTAYNLPTALQIDGVLDKARLDYALCELIQRHEALRTSFVMLDGAPLQCIHHEVSFELQEISAEESDLAILIPRMITPFDLRHAPLVHTVLIRLTPSRHVLLLDMHHIVADGVSVNILIHDLVGLYNGETLPLPRIQYPDFAAWQNALLSSKVMREQEEYWLNVFPDAPPVLNLPTYRRRPINMSFEGATVELPLEPATVAALRQLAVRKSMTLYMLLLAIYNVLLTLYTGLEDIVVGCPVAGRTHADLQDVVGVFVNVLALRNRPERTKVFESFLNEVRNNALRAYEHQDYPFEQLVNRLSCPRDTSRNPLFDTMLDFFTVDHHQLSLQGCTVTPYDFEVDTAKFDLSIDVVQTGDDLKLIFEYRTILFERSTIERLARHLMYIMRQVTEDPTLKIGNIELEPQQIREINICALTNTSVSYPQHQTVDQIFVQQVECTPDAVAVILDDEQVTYAMLHSLSNRVARLLQAEGVKHGDMIPIVAQRSLSMIVGLLAVLKVGAAYIPIDPSYPSERVKHVLQETNAPVILANREVIAAEEYLTHAHIVDLDDERAHTFEDTNISSDVDPTDIAYVIYTSGTSGQPKGVLVSHANLVNMCFAWKQEYDLAQFDVRLLQVASFAFDLFTADVMRALSSGGRLILCPKGMQVDLPRLGKLIEQQSITIFEATPALIVPLLNYGIYNDLRFDSLRILTLGSDAFYTQDYNAIRAKLPGSVKIINSYGVTEGTVDSCYYADGGTDGRSLNSLTVPIGRPFPNVQLYVLNDSLIPQPIGIPGELFIGGAGVTYGYLHRPEQTAAVFLPNPFAEGERMYKTGDQARLLADGNLELLGRIDDQIQLGGYRIELAEIEAQLLSIEGIKEAVVVCKSNSNDQKYLCAYVVASSGLASGTIKSILSARLPSYMIPSSINLLENLPVTSNGKIDRRALQSRQGEVSPEAAYRTPKNHLEAQLSAIWLDILGIERVSTTDSFFDVGGNSLLLLALFNRVNQEVDAHVSVVDLFSHHTIEMLAAKIQPDAQVSESGRTLVQNIDAILTDMQAGKIDIVEAQAALDWLQSS